VVTARAGDADTCAQVNPGGGCREPGHRATCSVDASDILREATGLAVEIDVEAPVDGAGGPPALKVGDAEPEVPQAVANVEATTTASSARSGRP